MNKPLHEIRSHFTVSVTGIEMARVRGRIIVLYAQIQPDFVFIDLTCTTVL